jgi:hypothetical protein
MGTYDVVAATHETRIVGQPEGFIYVPPGSPHLTNFNSLLVSEWLSQDQGNVAVYQLDARGNPIPASRQTFISDLGGAEGAVFDPLTGDFLFSTFGGGDRVVAVHGFPPPPGGPCTTSGDTGFTIASARAMQQLGASPNSGSLQLNGTSAYGEVPTSPELSPAEDWTIEFWFKDDDPNGFDHEFRYLLNKGDGVGPEAPYYVLVGNGALLAGVRTAGANHPLTYNLHPAGYSPKIWQHVAASFQANTTTLTLYLNGLQVARQVLGVRSTGNTLPLQIGRQGPVLGRYLTGKLDDLRIWNMLRSANEVQANLAFEFVSQPLGLVANWHFSPSSGGLAIDSAGNHTATLLGGTGYSSGVPPSPKPSSSTSTPTSTPTLVAASTSTATAIATSTGTASLINTATSISTTTPSSTATPTSTTTPSSTATPTGTPTPASTDTPSSTATITPTPCPSATPTSSPTPTATPTATPTHTPTATPSQTATPTPQGSANVAAASNGGHVIAVSSNFGGQWDVSNLIDGSPDSGWSTNQAQVTNQSAIVELRDGATYAIDRVRLDPAATGGDASANGVQHFEVRVSTTDAQPTSFQTIVQGTAPRQNTFVELIFPAVPARYVMLAALDNYGGAYLEAAELEVYGSAGPLPPVGTATSTFTPTAGGIPTVTATATPALATLTPAPTPSVTSTPTPTPVATLSPTLSTTTPTPTLSSTPSSLAVTIVDFAFQPATLGVDTGQTVVWTNTGATGHTVTSDTGLFDSGAATGERRVVLTDLQPPRQVRLPLRHPPHSHARHDCGWR